jgi:DNA-binding CsgD family transcriptional regulator
MRTTNARGHLSGRSSLAGLSRREQDVLRLVAAGRTDREIAADLFISPHTAGNHVRHILAKLDVSTRAAAVAAVRASIL